MADDPKTEAWSNFQDTGMFRQLCGLIALGVSSHREAMSLLSAAFEAGYDARDSMEQETQP